MADRYINYVHECIYAHGQWCETATEQTISKSFCSYDATGIELSMHFLDYCFFSFFIFIR